MSNYTITTTGATIDITCNFTDRDDATFSYTITKQDGTTIRRDGLDAAKNDCILLKSLLHDTEMDNRTVMLTACASDAMLWPEDNLDPAAELQKLIDDGSLDETARCYRWIVGVPDMEHLTDAQWNCICTYGEAAFS